MELRVAFSLPVTAVTADTSPALAVVIGSTSTARTLTYLTGSAVYTMNVSVDTSLNNSRSMFFKYSVGADDQSADLRCVMDGTLVHGDRSEFSFCIPSFVYSAVECLDAQARNQNVRTS